MKPTERRDWNERHASWDDSRPDRRVLNTRPSQRPTANTTELVLFVVVVVSILLAVR